jgi:hypothetical protein
MTAEDFPTKQWAGWREDLEAIKDSLLDLGAWKPRISPARESKLTREVLCHEHPSKGATPNLGTCTGRLGAAGEVHPRWAPGKALSI